MPDVDIIEGGSVSTTGILGGEKGIDTDGKGVTADCLTFCRCNKPSKVGNEGEGELSSELILKGSTRAKKIVRQTR